MEEEKILIYGAVGYKNIGDEAILSGILKQIKKKADIVVFSGSPKETSELHKIRAVRPNLPAIFWADRLILGGGGIFFDAYAHYFLIAALIAKLFGKTVEVKAVGVTKMTKFRSRFLVPLVLNQVNSISVRDVYSKEILVTMGVTKPIKIVEDPAASIDAVSDLIAKQILAAKGMRGGALCIGLALKFVLLPEKNNAIPGDSEKLIDTMAGIVDWLISQHGATVFFIPFCKHKRWFENDLLFAHELKKRVSSKDFVVLSEDYTPSKIKGILGQLDFLIGMRLHSLILASSAGIPAIGIIYDAKIQSFLETKHWPGIKVSEVTFLRLKRLIERRLEASSLDK